MAGDNSPQGLYWTFRPVSQRSSHQDFNSTLDSYVLSKTDDGKWQLRVSVASQYDDDHTGLSRGTAGYLAFGSEAEAKIYARAFHEAVNVMVNHDLDSGIAHIGNDNILRYSTQEHLRHTMAEANEVAQAAYNASSPTQTFVQIEQISRFYLRGQGVEIEGANLYAPGSGVAAYKISSTENSYAYYHFADPYSAAGKNLGYRHGYLELFNGDPNRTSSERMEYCSTDVTGMTELGSDFDIVHIDHKPVPQLHEAFRNAVSGISRETDFGTWQREIRDRYSPAVTGLNYNDIKDALIAAPLENRCPFGDRNPAISAVAPTRSPADQSTPARPVAALTR